MGEYILEHGVNERHVHALVAEAAVVGQQSPAHPNDRPAQQVDHPREVGVLGGEGEQPHQHAPQAEALEDVGLDSKALAGRLDCRQHY